jgi:hypothetical protein
MTPFKDLRLRFVILLALVCLSVVAWGTPNKVRACENCVFPDPGSGICVACTEGQGFRICEPNQDNCSCTVSGGSCRIGGLE